MVVNNPQTPVVLRTPELGFDSIDPSFPSPKSRNDSEQQSALYNTLMRIDGDRAEIFRGCDIALSIMAIVGGRRPQELIYGADNASMLRPYEFRGSHRDQWNGFTESVGYFAGLMSVSLDPSIPTYEEVDAQNVPKTIAVGPNNEFLGGVRLAALVQTFDLAKVRFPMLEMIDAKPKDIFITLEDHKS